MYRCTDYKIYKAISLLIFCTSSSEHKTAFESLFFKTFSREERPLPFFHLPSGCPLEYKDPITNPAYGAGKSVQYYSVTEAQHNLQSIC